MSDIVKKAPTAETFQSRVKDWMDVCFGPEISADKVERNYRFLEEALELVQACGCTEDDAHTLVSYVYGRPQGDINQEIGGTTVTLAALCLANDFNMHAAAEQELARIWGKIEEIRMKQVTKPKSGPLPQHVALSPTAACLPDHVVVRDKGLRLPAPDLAPLVRGLVAVVRVLRQAHGGAWSASVACEAARALAAAKAAGFKTE